MGKILKIGLFACFHVSNECIVTVTSAVTMYRVIVILKMSVLIISLISHFMMLNKIKVMFFDHLSVRLCQKCCLED